MSVIAFDYGTKHIGVAGGDLSMKIATPRDVIANKSPEYLREEITKMLKEWEPELFVVGLPISMDEGQADNPIIEEIHKFVDLLGDFGLKVVYFDERLSSFEAGEKAHELGHKSYKKDDALAAQVILQRYFDSLVD